jgi:hypothetical protein
MIKNHPSIFIKEFHAMKRSKSVPADVSYKDLVYIHICILGDEFTRDDVRRWFSELCHFQPYRLWLDSKPRRYKQEYLDTIIQNAGDDWGSLWIEDTTRYRAEIIRNNTSSFFTTMSVQKWLEQKETWLSLLDELFVRLNGCYGYVVNAFDDLIVQNPAGPKTYDQYNVTDDDFPGVREIPFIPCHPFMRELLMADPSYLPGHTTKYGNIHFGVAPYMWIGPDYGRLVEPTLTDTFEHCVYNVEIASGFRRICLWDDIREYNAPTYRDRQWSFRRELNLDERLERRFELLDTATSEKAKERVMVDITQGEFPNGGDMLARHYFDGNKQPCMKYKAVTCLELEMKNNEVVAKKTIKLA